MTNLPEITPPNFSKNCFDVIRLVCALCIMFSHYCVRTFGIENVRKEFLYAGSSLVIFFALQGYLVIPSALRNDVKLYLKKRILRLYPSFSLTLITTLIMVCFAGYKPDILDSLVYLIRELFLFDGVEFHGISNGAVWAIFIQIQIYVVAYVSASKLYKIDSLKIYITIFILLLVVNYSDKQILKLLDSIGLDFVGAVYTHLFIRYAYFFWIGIMIFKFYNIFIPLLKRYAYIILMFHLVWHYGIIKLPEGYCYTDPVTAITASLAAIGIAYRIGSIKLKYEISYDVFVWHMPVYSTLGLFIDYNGWESIALACSITIILSFLSNRVTTQVVKFLN